MALTEGLLLALVTMFSWGIADFIIIGPVKKIGKIPTLLVSGVGGVVALATYALLFQETLVFTAHASLLSLASGFLDLFGLYMFYRSMEKGKLSLVAPIANSWSVIAIAVGFVLFFQIPTTMQLIGAAVVITGLMLASVRINKITTNPGDGVATGVPEAFVALVSWGISHSVIKIPANEIGWLSASAVFLVAQLILISFVFVERKISVADTMSKSFASAFLAGLLLALGNISYINGVSSTHFSIVAPVASSAPVITVMLAFMLMKERLTKFQYAGVASVIAGIIIMAL